MRAHKVGLMLSSPLLTAGLREVLRKSHGLTIVDITASGAPETYSELITREPLSLIISDTFLAPCCSGVDIPILILTSIQTPDAVKDRYQNIVSIFDSSESIVNKINSIIEPVATPDQRGNDLSPREREVIKHLVKGLSNKEIASAMNVSVNTIMTHRRNIANKLEIHSPAGLTIFAIATGMVKLEDVAL